jgi:hypothetical protein
VGGTALPAPTSSLATFEAFFFAFPFTACDFVGEVVFAAGVFVGEVAFAAGVFVGEVAFAAGDFFLGGIVLPRCFAKYNPLVLLDLTRAGHSLKRCGFFTYPPSGRGPS